MRIGVSLRSGYMIDDPREGARWMIERVVAARESGAELLSVGDHHVTGIPYYQNGPILGRLLAEWDPERQFGALYLLPLWNPVLVAEQVGTLACLGSARFVLQCALGDGAAQFAGMGARIHDRVRDFEASLDVVLRLLAGERVTASRPIEVHDARVGPIPPEPVEVWIGADVETAIGRAARLGDAWYAGPGLTFDEARAKLGHYRHRCAVEGRSPERFPIRRDIHVASSASEADEVRAWAQRTGYRGFDLSALAIGTPDEVAAHFRELAGIGFTDVVIRQLADDQQQALSSYRLLAEVREAVLDA